MLSDEWLTCCELFTGLHSTCGRGWTEPVKKAPECDVKPRGFTRASHQHGHPVVYNRFVP